MKLRLLTFCSLLLMPLAHAGNSIYNAAVLADGPLTFWTFDEAVGATVANDIATAAGAPQQGAQNGTFENCTLGVASGALNLGTCMQLNGTSSRARFPYVSFFDLATGDFTVELWYKTTVTTRGDMFNFKNTIDFGIFSNNGVAGQLSGYHNVLLPTSTATPINTWYHMAYVRTGGNINLYVNGVFVATQADAASMSATVEITVGDNKGSSWFTGLIDEVAYYPSAVSAARLAAHYAAASQTSANAPLVTTTAATAITSTTATINGGFSQVGTPTPTVTMYWGPTNGGTVAGSWANNVPLGPRSAAFSTNLTGLSAATTYYVISYATNGTDVSWGLPAVAFTTANGPPSISNGTVTNLLATSATLAANVTNTGGAVPNVTIYFGTTDGGTTVGSWARNVSLGALSGLGSASVNALTMGATYFFRALATNGAGSTWAAASGTFTTPVATLPSVINTAATDINGSSATLRGTVTAIGNDPPIVKIYYGLTDGGTTAGSWTSNVSLPAQPADFAKAIGGLMGSTTYFYRAWVQNVAGTAWAPSSSSFTTTAGRPPATLVINEIHYHPVENDAFNADRTPVLDLSSDLHEFVEIYNATASPITLTGYKLSGGIDYTFPTGTMIPASGYKVIAKNPARMAIVYPSVTGVLGPYTGTLSNSGDTVDLEDAAGNFVDQVTYSAEFPWPTSANALGAADDFTLLDSSTYQYKGRSLERLSVAGDPSDPANWRASPVGAAPTPGAANAATLVVPPPVPVGFAVAQVSDEAPTIRAGNAVRVTFTLTSTAGLFNPQVEYFVDNVNSFSEVHNSLVLTSIGNSQFTATLPGQVDRSVVRYRLMGNLGAGLVQIAPRLDDALIVPVSFTGREAWCSYFVTPVRTSVNPIYDLFVSTDGTATNPGAAFNGLNGQQTMGYNVLGNPKRATTTDTTGVPRDLPYVSTSSPLWNGSVPAIFIENGNVRDVHWRLHGSRYNRSPTRPTFKLRFSDTQRYQDADSEFITDKQDYFSVMHGLYENANLPISHVRWIDFYQNTDAKVTKLEQGEYNGDLLSKFHDRQAALNPGTPKEASGEFFKDVGIIASLGVEGPYATGDGRLLVGSGLWNTPQLYEWTYLQQNHGWKGPGAIKTFFESMWAARGDTVAVPAPNVTALRTYFDSVMDVDTELTSMAILNWGCPWDDTSQNHFFWQRANGKWAHFPWDFDGFFGNGDTTGTNSWIYLGENSTPTPATNVYGTILGNNSRGPNYFKDSFLKAYRTEYNNRLWILNNTYLHPDTLKTIFFTTAAATQQSYYSYINSVKATFCDARFTSVNVQLGHAADGSDFLRPTRPTNSAPLSAATALPPAALTATAYTHSSGSTAGLNGHAKSKWEIRNSTGTYLEPAAVITSTTSLVSLPIPFDKLTFGQTYFWRVTYYDGNAHPSIVSLETSFVYGPQSTTQTIINFSDIWSYNLSITPTNTDLSWSTVADPSPAWPLSGAGTLAFESQASIPETIRTVLPDPRLQTFNGRAYYFRKHFNFPANPMTSTIRIRHVVDDSCAIYINGQRVHRYYLTDPVAPATGYDYKLFSAASSSTTEAIYAYADVAPANSTATNWVYLDPRPYMVAGDNVIAVEVHQTATNSSDIVFGLEMTAVLPGVAGDVVINEILADNASAVLNGTGYPDYIELKNNTAAAISLAGNGLTDDILIPTRYVFPAGTSIPANGYLTVWCDTDTAAPGLHTGFGLSSNGQRVVLTNGSALRDFVSFGPQARNLSIGRIPNGTGSFTLTTPTANATNTAVATLGAVANLKINEWMASPAHGDDWFEIYNPDANPIALGGLYLSDTPGTPLITQIPSLSYIAGKGFADFAANGTNEGDNKCNFKLSGSGERIVLTSTTGGSTLNLINFGAQVTNVSQGRFPDGGGTIVSFPQTDSKGDSNWLRQPAISINEALTNSVAPLQDYIELRNRTGTAVDASGWWLSDDRGVHQKYSLPAGSVVPANGYLTFYESAFNTGINAFSLSSTGDEIILSATSGGAETGYRDQVSFGAAADNFSFGSVATSGEPEFWAQTVRTPNAANAAPKIQQVLINEIDYHPLDLAGAVDNARDEFIELHNAGATAVNISGWKLKSGVDFLFASGTTLAADSYMLVVGFNPVTDSTSLAAFKTALNVPAGTVIYGPFTPVLSNGEASVELAFPGAAVLGVIPFILQDKVKYSDVNPWTSVPDGTGSSLQRVSRSIIGNDPSNWIGATPTPGAVNATEAPLDTDGDGIPNAWEIANGLDPANAADALLDSDGDGQTNVNEYLAQTNPRSATDVLRASFTVGATSNIITFTAKANVTYSILVSTDLNAATWAKLADVPAGNERSISITDPGSQQRRFYKLLTPAQP